MAQVYKATHYLQVIETFLRTGGGSNRRGISKLATQLKVHPTFIAKTLAGKANFSMEQALAFAAYAGLDADETEFFCDLLARDRAGDKATRAHFNRRLRRHLDQHANLKERLKSQRDLSLEQQVHYYHSWLPQAIHVYCQLPGKHSVASIAAALKINMDTAAQTTQRLVEIGLLAKRGENLHSTADFLHTGTEAVMVQRLHSNWRHKTITHLLDHPHSRGTHFSGVCSLSAAVERIRALLIDALEESKQLIADADPETVYVLAMDFYPLLSS